MKHSLQLSPPQVHGLYDRIKKSLSDKTPLKEAYLASTNIPGHSIGELPVSGIDEHIDFVAGRGAGPDAQLLFDILSHLARLKALSVDDINGIADQLINRADSPGRLVINDHGIWDLQWEVGPPDRTATLSICKYDPEIGEVVPEPIAEILQSMVLCLRSGSNLAALSLALVAFEAALWDHLSIKGIGKAKQVDKYPLSVRASLKWDGKQYTLELFDHAGALRAPAAGGEISFEVFRTSYLEGGTHRVLRVLVDDAYADWLSCSDGKTTEKGDPEGFNVALQRARKERLLTVGNWDRQLDETFRVLRNDLIHRSSDHQDIEVHTPYGMVKLDEFAEKQELALFFITRIMRYISDAYYELQIENLG